MLARASETYMRCVRYGLLLLWFGLLALMVVDVGQSRITDPTDPLYLPGLAGSTIELREQVLPAQPYNPAPRAFWGLAIPVVVLVLIFLGHDAWRRMCPLSALNQIPRLLGWQIKFGKGSERKVALISPNSWLARYAIVLQFVLFVVVVILRLTVFSANPDLLFYFTLSLMLLVLMIGFFWGGKTWCHYFCPMNAVQLALSGPRALNASAALGRVSQSMCRKPSSSGDVSICVGCNAPCPDVDIEKNYWDRLPQLSRRFVVYGYLGTVLGFVHGLYATAGGFHYGAAVWYDADWQAVGFAPWGEWLPVSRILGMAGLMLFWVMFCFAVGVLVEQLQQRFYRSFSADARLELSRHRTMTVSTFLAVLLLVYQVALPGMGWLPRPLVTGLGLATTIAMACWAYRSWQRSGQQYQREALAGSMRRRLQQLRSNWSQHLAGRQVEDLSADELYLLANLVPKLEASNRLAFYQAFLADAIEQGTASSIEGRKLLAEVRDSCGISDDDHEAIVESFKGDSDISDNLLLSASLRMASFKQQIEKLLYSAISSGRPLADALAEHQGTIESLRENYSISEQEEAQVIKSLASKSGPLTQALQLLLRQLRQLLAMQMALDPRSNGQLLLLKYLQQQAEHVVRDCLGLVEALDESDDYFKELALTLFSQHPQAVSAVLSNPDVQWSSRLPSAFMSAITKDVPVASDAISAADLSTVLATYANSDQQFLALVSAREAQLQGYAWAQEAFSQAWKRAGYKTTPPSSELRLSLNVVDFDGTPLNFKPDVTAGRAADNDWIIALPQASRHHFRLYCDGVGLRCEDLQSSNGTFLNGQHLQSQSAPLGANNTIAVEFNGQTATVSVEQRYERDWQHPVDLFAKLSTQPAFEQLAHAQLLELVNHTQVTDLMANQQLAVKSMANTDLTLMLLTGSAELSAQNKKWLWQSGLPLNQQMLLLFNSAHLSVVEASTVLIWPTPIFQKIVQHNLQFNNHWLIQINQLLQS